MFFMTKSHLDRWGMPSRRGRSWAFLFFLLLAFVSLGAEEGGLFLLSQDGRQLAIVEENRIVKTLELPILINRLYATPGGGYLFLLGEDGRYLAMNGLTRELEKAGQFPLESTRWLTFSPTGYQLYLQDGNRVLVLDHTRGEVSHPRDLDIPAGEALSFNRRGTRYYRNSQGNLEYRLLKDNSRIEQVQHMEGITHWQTGPRFSTLWGIRDDGELIVVDEARGTVRMEQEGPYLETPLQFFRNRVYLLGDQGKRWVSMDQRRYQEDIHWVAPEKLFSLHQGDGFWYFPAAQSEKLWIWKGEEPGQESDFSLLELDFPVKDSLWMTLKQGQGYACF